MISLTLRASKGRKERKGGRKGKSKWTSDGQRFNCLVSKINCVSFILSVNLFRSRSSAAFVFPISVESTLILLTNQMFVWIPDFVPLISCPYCLYPFNCEVLPILSSQCICCFYSFITWTVFPGNLAYFLCLYFILKVYSPQTNEPTAYLWSHSYNPVFPIVYSKGPPLEIQGTPLKKDKRSINLTSGVCFIILLGSHKV